MSDIRVRFAPSPTGVLHLGGARTALFNYLYARHTGGKFVLRIEDTDKERSTDESTQAILDAMAWLGMTPDEEVVYQSKRADAHEDALNRLIAENKVYRCYCTAEERAAARDAAMAAGKPTIHRCGCRDQIKQKERPFVWRFKMPRTGQTVFDDLVQGKIVTRNEEIEDLVVARADGSPLYNFVVVVDDAFMGITHVIRGKDHLTNTPKQIQIYKALGLTVPQFGHLPLILGLSKRLRSAGVEQYREQGYLRDGLINYIARLGWSSGDQEIFDYDEIIEKFDLGNVNRSEGSLDLQKMEWVNQQHIQKADGTMLAELIVPFLAKLGLTVSQDDPRLLPAIETMRPRAKTLVEMAENMAFYFVPDEALELDAKAVAKFLNQTTAPHLEALADTLENCTDWTHESIEAAVRGYITEMDIKLKLVAQPCRVAMVGRAAGPGLYETMVVLGQEATMARLRRAAQVGR